jgi:hypothetical protein
MSNELPEKLPKENKKQRSFASFWRHGFKRAFKKSWEKYGHALIAFGLFYTLAAFWLVRHAEAKLLGVDMSSRDP